MLRPLLPPLVIVALLAATPALPETLVLAPQEVPEWKAVYGRVEARDRIPARARIGGTVAELLVTEGDQVTAGQRIAVVRDDKIAFQTAALDAQLRALEAQLTRAEAELARGRELVERGVTTTQRLEALETDADVTRNQIAAIEAQRAATLQQEEEGAVLAPAAGLVLSVPVTRGAVIMPGEALATIGGGGFFLRLAIPERHAAALQEGAALRITTTGAEAEGRLARIYPLIENGRVIADVEVPELDARFVDARVPVAVPVGTRPALIVPQAALSRQSGLDFVRVQEAGHETARAVVPGEPLLHGGAPFVEILTGLHAGDIIVLP